MAVAESLAGFNMETIGLVKVLLVNVSLPSNVAKVPLVGKVKLVIPESVSEVAKLPFIVIVLASLLLMPVPPLLGGTMNEISPALCWSI